MKTVVFTLIAASLFSTAVMANSGPHHRIGLGVNNTSVTAGESDDSLDMGLKLEYGFELNPILAANVSYVTASKEENGFEIKAPQFKADIEAGYTFPAGNFAFKPYAAVGVAHSNFEQSYEDSSHSESEVSLLLGLGLRTYIADNFYADARYDMTEPAEGVELNSLSLTFGYRF
ncbi:porin family protein [Vibrio sp. SCSIO 43135]|uniref:porin family protein n=1 Tax=Vibrio sp. SCSIO 43135 TaxID=2819096 RepID=UPI00207619C1|nr:porin family protein [Vibrio sp. SCSIO 43135]USD40570.1 porin family protein [Vibrio sp. SCSIO 43135]